MPDAVLTGRHTGLANLFDDCIGLKTDDRLLLVVEAAEEAYYDRTVVATVAEGARARRAHVECIPAPVVEDPSDLTPDFLEAISKADHTVFMARLGDQLRFGALTGNGSKTMCYALDRELLCAPFTTLPHKAMLQVADEVESVFASGHGWRIRCPLGTDVRGESLPKDWRTPSGSAGMKRFPMMTFQPVPADSMHGRVALSRWLIGTGSRLYRPYALNLSSLVFARVEHGRIVGFEGKSRDVNSIEAHYEHVAKRYGLNRDRVHSWHVGLNPGTFYSGSPEADLMRWGGIAFGAPRYLHFHTCGDEAPGEICWSVFDATVEVDGKALWRDGAFQFTQHEHFSRISAAYPALSEAYAHARTDIGV